MDTGLCVGVFASVMSLSSVRYISVDNKRIFSEKVHISFQGPFVVAVHSDSRSDVVSQSFEYHLYERCDGAYQGAWHVGRG